ncbi:MAG: extracellular solute-binding protein [Candidatus Thiodiazotropha sp. (ex Epidulcina cf. delphinae)]|nr:extracellular solute-binding protein [Candidatus Thiodiazotropha sp. (ex Epidulcina cf. delphinae)]
MLLWTSLAAALSGCENDGVAPADVAMLTVWAHAGQESERSTLQAQVSRFNNAHTDLEIQLTLIPEGSYNSQVQAAAVAGELPDILELDGPFLYAYAWQGHLRPLDGLLTDTLRADLLPSIIEQGRYRGHLWSVAVFDSGLGLYADRSKLLQAGIRIPTLEHPWKGSEFEEILQQLARLDPDGQVLDLKLNYAGEWYTYGLSPLIQSAGGDLIDRRDYAGADGVLNGPQTVAIMTTLQNWIQDNRIDPNIDDAAFVTRRTALAVGGHWNYRRYHAGLGDDLLLLPLPDFGRGSKTGQGSWCWAVTAGSRQPEAASEFLAFLLSSDEVLSMTGANDAVPATRSAISRSPLYRPGGPLRLFVEQLEGGHAVPRPRTPAYPLITAEFQRVLDRIRSGSDVQATLDNAVRAIDGEIKDNHGYPRHGSDATTP